MYRIRARDLLFYDKETLWNGLYGDFVLCFDDGELITNRNETYYSALAWDFHRSYPQTPLLVKHHVQPILKGKRLGSKTHLNLVGNVMFSVKETYHSADPMFLDGLLKQTYQVVNAMYNDLIRKLEPYVTSIDILDFIEVMEHEDTKPVLDAVRPERDSIDACYEALLTLLNDEKKLPNNPIGKAVRSGLVNKNQVLQCVGPRGYLTDIDSNLFRKPITRGYVAGMRSLYDSLIESRSAAKSLFFAKDPLEDAEFFSRRLQLLCMNVRHLHRGDCGSTKYVKWKVRDKIVNSHGKVIYGGDLGHLEGKHYLDETTGQLKTISINDKHLNGKTIQMRSVIAGCDHPDPAGVCTTCFGELSDSIPLNGNLGLNCSTAMTNKSSQSVLSVKHLDGSSDVEDIVIHEKDKEFLRVSNTRNSYLLSDRLIGKKVFLIIPQAEAISLTDINQVNNVEELNITRVSEITTIFLQVYNQDEAVVVPLDVSVGNRLASLTYSMLNYIKQEGWTLDQKGNFMVDLTRWDYSKSFLTLPLKHFNMSDHSKELAVMIESRVKDLEERDQFVSPEATLVELCDLVNSRLNVNVAVLEIVLYASMVVSNSDEDYRLPKPWTKKALGVSVVTIPNRSLAAAMAYQFHRETILSINSFFANNRPSHPMDIFLMPKEVIENMPK